MVSKTAGNKQLVTPSETAPEHLANPFDDPQIHEVESIITKLAEDLVRSEGDVHSECLKSLCSQSAVYRDFARLCVLRGTAQRLQAEIAATRRAAKDSLVAAAASHAEEDDTINL